MQKGGFKGIFKNAITKVKECHLTSIKDSNDIMDDEIDFENQKLGESQYEPPNSKMRSAIISNEKKNTPYQMSSNSESKVKHLIVVKNNKKTVKTIGNKKILLKRQSSPSNILPNNKFLNKSDNFTWKHDLFNDIPKINYKVFIRNLSLSVTQEKLRDIFSEYGIISGINVKKLIIQIERDTAEIYFIRKDSAGNAAKNANGREINGKKIKSTFYDEDIKNQTEKKSDILININSKKREPIWDRIKLVNN